MGGCLFLRKWVMEREVSGKRKEVKNLLSKILFWWIRKKVTLNHRRLKLIMYQGPFDNNVSRYLALNSDPERSSS
jgi:hypothetical protein